MKAYEDIWWWHAIDLPDGRRTPGFHYCKDHVKTWGIKPKQYRDKTVLDIGSWDGGYCFVFEEWGAADVLATDSWAWEHHGTDGIEYCIEQRGSNVRMQFCKTFDISPETVGTFDVVMMCGVFYHLRNPLISLDKEISVVNPGGMMCVETCINEVDNRKDIPQMAYYPGPDPYYDDESTWFGPNNAMMLSLLEPYFGEVTHKNWDVGGKKRGFFQCYGRNEEWPDFEYW